MIHADPDLDKLRRYARGVAFRLGMDWDHEAEDAAQEAVLDALERSAEGKSPRAAHYIVRDVAARHFADRATLASGEEWDGLARTVQDPSGAMLRPGLADSAKAARVREAVRALPESDRHFLLSRYWYGTSVREAAEFSGQEYRFASNRLTKRILPALRVALSDLEAA